MNVMDLFYFVFFTNLFLDLIAIVQYTQLSPTVPPELNDSTATNNCADRADFELKKRKRIKYNKRKRKNCEWVGERKTRKRCRKKKNGQKVSEYWCMTTCSEYNDCL